jgi:hypothetical protein
LEFHKIFRIPLPWYQITYQTKILTSDYRRTKEAMAEHFGRPLTRMLLQDQRRHGPKPASQVEVGTEAAEIPERSLARRPHPARAVVAAGVT